MFKNYLRWMGALLLCGAVAAQAAGQNKITGLSVSSSGQGDSVLKVQLAEPLASLPAGFSINAPARIALDFPGTENGLGRSVQEFSGGDLRSANIIQAGTRTRLVLNLSQMLAYDAKLDGNALLITLHGKAADTASAGNAARFADASKTSQKHALTDVDFRRGSNGEGRIQVDLSDPGLGIDIRRQGTKLIVDFQKTSLPRNLQRKLDVVDFATPVQMVDTFAQGEDTRMVIEPKGNWEHSAYQTDNKFIIEIKQVAEDANQLGSSRQAGYTGEKLTLNFQDITVREALNVIADFTELNMVISDTVQGNLTLRLKDVPWDQALDIILQSRGLDMRRSGNVIQVAPREELAAKEKTDLTARQEISQLEELQTESFRLGYARAADAAKILMGQSTASDKASGGDQGGGESPAPAGGAKGDGAQAVASPRILSSRGSAMADARTNTLFVKDTPSRLDDVRRILKQIDVPARQVLIEARVVEASDGFARNLGVRLGYTDRNAVPVAAGGANGVAGVRGGLVTAGAGVGMTVVPNMANVNLPFTPTGQPLAGLFQFSLFNAAASKILNVELNAMESDDQGKIISSPRVVSIDKDTEWAIIEQGEEIPYLINSIANGVVTTTVAFKKAVLKLGVKTNITPDNNIDMTVEVRKDSRGVSNAAGVPNINTNKVETKVLVENGGTVVIGGVYKQSDASVVNKVPLLGDIPVVGNLFKSKGTSVQKNELLVFLSPKIMQDALNLR